MKKVKILERLKADLIENKEYNVTFEYDKKGLCDARIEVDC